ncbi:unnamed protein product [Rotaria sordida]|uniref:Uncharacterized protein n=1 Tax=Rotaria sordida TaxID=392033 RepID=A0A818K7B9_9BILA|nr:unnamed protein product [Rotaria sordida]CAF0884438.1 unnamed protein product [Rotaria sordida]CAF3550891.1 unnamed protein product [Rotaria sordida]CAF3581247.1 unnamed protein product [Rotaria sordida]
MNYPHRIQPILYTCDYLIENLSAGIYSVFAFEDCDEAHGSFCYPQKQAFGWSTSEILSKWTQHTIYNSNTAIINANIILRKPHSFFSAGYPIKTETARFYTINRIPILQLNSTTPVDRGYSHGYLLAPHILDWFYFYLLEENFESISKYQEFYALVDPASNFFHYPVDYLLEIQGIIQGMQARTDCNLFLYEFDRPFDRIDLLAMNSYIERRTIKTDPRTDEMVKSTIDDAVNYPNCSQVVVWNRLTTDKRIIAGRNMDGECDIRRVTVSTTVLFAVNSSDKSKQYRYISLMWPGMIGTLSGVNETGLYCMENAGPSQIGGQIKGLTPVSYIATHVLRTLNAHFATITEVKNAFEAFVSDPILNNDSKIWPIKRAPSELKGPIYGPGSVFVLTTMSNDGGNACVLEGDRYGGRIRTSMQAIPLIPDCIIATNHFHLYDFTSSLHDKHCNFDSDVSFSSLHRYESMRHRLEMEFRLKSNVVHLNVENIRSLLQSACEGRTEHTIEVELETNGNITIHVHLAASIFGLWYAPYEPARTIQFEDLFT